MLLPLDRSRPLTDQIYLHLREAVLRGELASGVRLPSSRRMARANAVARNTVVAAYHRLQAEGYLVGRGAAGTRVADDLPRAPIERRARRGGDERSAGPASGRRSTRPAGRLSRFARRVTAAPSLYPPAVLMDRARLRWDFQYNVNVADAASRRAWYRTLRRSSTRHEQSTIPYDFAEGPGPLQRALVRYLRMTRGVFCRAEQVLVTNGFQHAFELATRVLLDPGDRAVVEDPHRIGIRNVLRAHGVRVVPGASDEHGLRVERLVARGVRAPLLYTNAAFQWPTGAVLPLSRRMQLLDWARRTNGWIVEGDHNGEYHYHGTPVESLQGLDGGTNVLYAGTFARLISPDPEIGYLVVPEPLIEPFRAARTLGGFEISRLQEETLARFLESGEMEGLLRRATRRLRELRHCLVGALCDLPGRPLRVRESAGGLHVHALMPDLPPGDLERLVARAAQAGVGVFPDRPYFLRAPRTAGLILGFAAMTPAEIREGVRRLGRVIDSGQTGGM